MTTRTGNARPRQRSAKRLKAERRVRRRRIYRAVWRFTLPAGVILVGVGVGLICAIVVRASLVSISNGLIGLSEKAVHLLQAVLPQKWAAGLIAPDPIDSLSPGFDLGLGGFGAVALLTKASDISDGLAELLGVWHKAESALRWKVFLNLVIGFAGLGLSVYGFKQIAQPIPANGSPTFVFDALDVPPYEVRSDTGHLAFYVSFFEEGGAASFRTDDDPSVTVSPSNRDFLSRLSEALSACGRDGGVRVKLEGFASGSPWTIADTGLRDIIATNGLNSANKTCDLDATGPQAATAALACVETYQNGEAERTRPGDLLSRPNEVGKAFNVYLANRRRAAVQRLLIPNGTVTANVQVEGGPWTSYREMEDALVVDDSKADAIYRIKGILTRSVAVTVTDPGICSKTKVDKVVRTSLTLR